MLCAAQELDDRDVTLYRRYLSRAAIHPTAVAADAPTAVAEAAAVADPTAVSEPPADTAIATMAAEEDQDAVVTEEMLEAMRWASNLNHDPSLLYLIRNLPADIVAEQVAAYRERDKPRKKDDEALQQKIHLTTIRTHQQRMSVCLRFHRYCRSIGVEPDMKMPYGAMKTFIRDNLTCMSDKPPSRQRHTRVVHALATVANASRSLRDRSRGDVDGKTVCVKSLLRSRKHVHIK